MCELKNRAKCASGSFPTRAENRSIQIYSRKTGNIPNLFYGAQYNQVCTIQQRGVCSETLARAGEIHGLKWFSKSVGDAWRPFGEHHCSKAPSESFEPLKVFHNTESLSRVAEQNNLKWAEFPLNPMLSPSPLRMFAGNRWFQHWDRPLRWWSRLIKIPLHHAYRWRQLPPLPSPPLLLHLLAAKKQQLLQLLQARMRANRSRMMNFWFDSGNTTSIVSLDMNYLDQTELQWPSQGKLKAYRGIKSHSRAGHAVGGGKGSDRRWNDSSARAARGLVQRPFCSVRWFIRAPAYKRINFDIFLSTILSVLVISICF